ncbi:MAG: alpha/beta hydrolase [Bacteroidota bacterium]
MSSVLFAKTPDVKIAYRTMGSGDPLLMIIGYGSTMDMWADAVLDALAGNFKVIIFDNRGMGYSEIINDEDFTLKLFARDAVNLLKALNIGHAHVLGWSMGSMVAQEMALEYPDFVDKLVLYGTNFGDVKCAFPEPWVGLLMSNPDMSFEQFLTVLFPPEWLTREDAMKQWPDISESQNGETTGRQYTAIMNWYTPGGGTYGRLDKLRQKTLLLTGSEDVLVPPQNSELMAELIPDSSVIMIDGGGHGVIYQYPEELASHVLNFLAI